MNDPQRTYTVEGIELATTTTRFLTSGMHCGSCAMLIDMTVKELPGVESSSTDLATGATVVTYDDSAQTPESIMQSIRGAGYEASVA